MSSKFMSNQTTTQTSRKGAPIGYELLLLLVTVLWGTTFVAQSVAMDEIGPFTYVFSRFIISSAVLGVVSLVYTRINKKRAKKKGEVFYIDKKRTLIGGILCGIALFLGTIFQQIGLVTTTVGEGSFLSGCYIVLVPIAGIFLKNPPRWNAWAGVLIAMVGIYFISVEPGTGGVHVTAGNLWMLLSALSFTFHILTVDKYSHGTDLMWLACIEFGIIALIAFFGMLIFEEVRWVSVKAATVPILYAALVSGSFCYTTQNIAQKHIEPTLASLIMGTEAVFATLSGALVLHEDLGVRKLLGCGFMLIAIIAAQLPMKKK